jgi:hypothetical protein
VVLRALRASVVYRVAGTRGTPGSLSLWGPHPCDMLTINRLNQQLALMVDYTRRGAAVARKRG